MKKFFTNIPLQKPGQLQKCHYQAIDNSILSMEEATSFPIIQAINGFVAPGEEFRLIAVAQENNEDVKDTCDCLQDELKELCERKHLNYPENGVERAGVPDDQRVSSNVAIFQSLLNYVDDNDELFACVTFGTKPMSMALLTAIRYAYRIKRNTIVSCIVYGEVDRRDSPNSEDWIYKIYDETALVQLDEIIRLLADRGVSNPKETIDAILSL